ncbi:MAG: methyltransferase domain-containing protein [Methanomicrobiales archaeon]|nr:methyltransferase domain-containing protein [Methanomicrobiales archaeon]MDD1662972.1 methyltransferase domain-containing protein [Methanomicrobiales archaeon]MDD1668455.1 methyltransferase domain-containing protein [Methanomicrobiales archaeon]
MNEKTVPDLNGLSDAELHRLNIYHTSDEHYSERQLHSLYGMLNEDQDRSIIRFVKGPKVLDVGAGYGTLSRRLKDAGFEVTSIEPDPHMREIAKKWNDVDELPHSIYKTPFDANSFDTVILRECVEHLDFIEALKEIRRICNKRVLVFEPNVNAMITLARKIVSLEEYNPQDLDYYRKHLTAAGFTKQEVIFRDLIAFPLSGGYCAPQLIPRIHSIERAVRQIDKTLTDMARYTRLASFLCWRYLLISDT